MKVERPQFELTRLLSDGTSEPPEIVPVTRMPWDTQMNRRGVLGVGIGATAALFLLDSSSQAGDRLAEQGQQTANALKAPEKPVPAHANRISALAITPDGHLLVSGAQDNAVKFWSFPEGRLLQTLPAQAGDVADLAITPDGKTLITASNDTLRLWSLPAGQPQNVLDAHTDVIRAMAISGDGKLLVSAGEDKTIRFWSLPEGRLLNTIKGQRAAVHSLTLMRDGKTLLAAGREGGLKLWSVPEGRLLLTLRGSVPFAIAPDGETIALGSSAPVSSGIELRSLSDGRLLKSLEPRTRVSALAFSPDGKILIASAREGLTFWSMPEGSLLRTVATTGHNVTRLSCSPDGRMFLSWGSAGGAWLWSLPEGQLLAQLQADAAVSAALFVPSEGGILTGQSRGSLACWDSSPPGFRRHLSDPGLSASKPADRTIKAHAQGVAALAVTADGKMLASVAGMGYGELSDFAKIWSLPDGRLLATIDNHKDGTSDIVALPDGKTIVTAGNDKTIKLWALPEISPPAASGQQRSNRRSRPQPARSASRQAIPKGRLIATLEGHQASVRKLSLSPDGQMLVSTDANKVTKVWALPEGRLQATIWETNRAPVVLAFSPDWNLMITTTESREDQTVQLWSLPDGQLQKSLAGHRGKVRACAVAPDSRMLATCADGGEIRLWELPSGRLLGSIEQPASHLAFSPDGKLLATGRVGDGVRIWSVADVRLVMTLEDSTQVNYAASATTLLFAPNGRWLISSGSDGDLRLWSLSEGRLLATFDVERTSSSAIVITPDSKILACGYSSGVIVLWDLEKPGFRGFLFDAAVNTTDTKGITYNVHDQVTGRTITYTLPCGSPIPPGAICTCNCVPGTYRGPTYSGGGSRSGGVIRTGRTICTCNKICTCIPVPSDRELKEAFEDVDPPQILQRLSELPIQIWSYRQDGTAIRHIGPMAQDFAAAFAVGEDDKHISPVDAQGVALSAIQGLHQIVREQERLLEDQIRLNESLQQRLELQEERNREMKARLEALERMMTPR